MPVRIIPNFGDAVTPTSRLVKLANAFVKFAKSEFFLNPKRRDEL